MFAECRQFLLDLFRCHQNVEPADSHHSIEVRPVLTRVKQKSKRVYVEAHNHKITVRM